MAVWWWPLDPHRHAKKQTHYYPQNLHPPASLTWWKEYLHHERHTLMCLRFSWKILGLPCKTFMWDTWKCLNSKGIPCLILSLTVHGAGRVCGMGVCACTCSCMFCAWISCRRRLAWAHCLLISIPICLSPTVMLPPTPQPHTHVHFHTHTCTHQPTLQCIHTLHKNTHIHEHRHPHSTQIPPPQCLLSLIMNTEADRIACKCTRVHTHTYKDSSAALAVSNTTSTRHGLEYPPTGRDREGRYREIFKLIISCANLTSD